MWSPSDVPSESFQSSWEESYYESRHVYNPNKEKGKKKYKRTT